MTTDNTLIRTLLVLVAVVLLLPFLMMALMMPTMGAWGWGHMDGGMWATGGAWTWLLGWLVMLLVVAGIGYLTYSAVRRSEDSGTDPALEELRGAYARGELSDEEFERRRERLRREE